MMIICAESFHGFAGKFCYVLYYVVIRCHFCALARDDSFFIVMKEMIWIKDENKKQ